MPTPIHKPYAFTSHFSWESDGSTESPFRSLDFNDLNAGNDTSSLDHDKLLSANASLQQQVLHLQQEIVNLKHKSAAIPDQSSHSSKQ